MGSEFARIFSSPCRGQGEHRCSPNSIKEGMTTGGQLGKSRTETEIQLLCCPDGNFLPLPASLRQGEDTAWGQNKHLSSTGWKRQQTPLSPLRIHVDTPAREHPVDEGDQSGLMR